MHGAVPDFSLHTLDDEDLDEVTLVGFLSMVVPSLIKVLELTFISAGAGPFCTMVRLVQSNKRACMSITVVRG